MTGPAGTPTGTPAGTPAGSVSGTPGGAPVPRAAPAPADAPDPAGAPDGADPAPVSTPGEGAPRPRRRRPLGGRRVWTIAFLGVVVLALTAALVAVVRAPSDAEVRDSALLAATTYTTSLTTFDARTFDDDAERVRRSSTPAFVAEYDQTVEDLRETVTSTQLVSTGTVVGAGLEELDGSTATVLVAVDQELRSAQEQPRSEANRLRMVLERSDGRWLIREVERL